MFLKSNNLQLLITYSTTDTAGETKMHIGIIENILATTVTMTVYTMKTVQPGSVYHGYGAVF